MTTIKAMPIKRWDELTAMMRERETLGERCVGMDSSLMTGNADWNGTETMADAIRMMSLGYPDGTRRVIAAMNAATDQDALNATWQLDIAGWFPSVPALVSGDPECMWAQDESYERPRITLAVTGSYPADTEAAAAERYAAALAAVVRALEAGGVEVAVKVVACAHDRATDEERLTPVIVKDHGSVLDIDRVAMSMHPSFLRRAIFAWRELEANAGDRTMRSMVERDYGITRELSEERLAHVVDQDEVARSAILPRVDRVERLGVDGIITRMRTIIDDKLRAAA